MNFMQKYKNEKLKNLQYLIEDNILKLSNKISFGLEIEFQLRDESNNKNIKVANIILEELRQRNLTNLQKIGPIDRTSANKITHKYTEWILKNESSSDYELTSPILYDKYECWKEINDVCEILNQNGAYIDDSCAIHIHIGVGIFYQQVINGII